MVSSNMVAQLCWQQSWRLACLQLQAWQHLLSLFHRLRQSGSLLLSLQLASTISGRGVPKPRHVPSHQPMPLLVTCRR